MKNYQQIPNDELAAVIIIIHLTMKMEYTFEHDLNQFLTMVFVAGKYFFFREKEKRKEFIIFFV
jgi:hypothetical protein